jgi:hypothetical protein
MDTKSIIETANTKLVEITEVCTGINDNLEVFVGALRDVLDNVTAIYAQCAAWSADDFVMLPTMLKETGFDSETIVALTDIYYQNRAANASTPSPIITALTVGANYWAEQLVEALRHDNISPPALIASFNYLVKLIESYASEGDDVAIDLLRRYRESISADSETVNDNDGKVEENA